MADWDGLRHELEGAVTPPPFAALRERRRHRQQRRAIAATSAVVLIGIAGGMAVLGHGPRGNREAGPQPAGVSGVTKVALGDRVPPKGDYKEYVVTDVDFVTPDTGWAIGLRCSGETCDVATWRTDDGGASWGPERRVGTHLSRASFTEQDPAGGGARSLRMVNDTEGFAFNPDLYVTHDGARTWTRVPQPSKVSSVSVVGDAVWTYERGCAADDDCDTVLRTATLGKSFALHTAGLPETAGAQAILRRSDERHGYLLTWAAPSGPAGALYRTADAGTTWQPATNPCPSAEAASMSAGVDRPLLLVCTTPKGKQAYVSTDAGSSWRRLPDPPATGTITDLVSVSPTTAYLTTKQPARVLVTADGGTTWAPARGTVVKAFGFANLDAVDPRHLWAMGDAGALWRTSDGLSWSRVALPPGGPKATGTPRALPPADPGVRFTGLSFLDADRGYAVGSRCAAGVCRTVLRRTGDGGRTWQPVNAPTAPGRITQVRFADDRNGWLYGTALWTTHDGGATWGDERHSISDVEPHGSTAWLLGYDGCAGKPCREYVYRGPLNRDAYATLDGAPDLSHTSFAAVDETHAYLVDDASPGHGAATSDGGETWTRYAAPCPSAASRALSAWAPDRLWVLCVGGDGRLGVARSDDAGAHWHTVVSQTVDKDASAVYALSATDGWLVGGDSATPLRVTRDAGRTWSAVPLGARSVSDLAVVSPTQAWALGGDGVVHRTTDGTTWETLTRP